MRQFKEYLIGNEEGLHLVNICKNKRNAVLQSQSTQRHRPLPKSENKPRSQRPLFEVNFLHNNITLIMLVLKSKLRMYSSFNLIYWRVVKPDHLFSWYSLMHLCHLEPLHNVTHHMWYSRWEYKTNTSNLQQLTRFDNAPPLATLYVIYHDRLTKTSWSNLREA